MELHDIDIFSDCVYNTRKSIVVFHEKEADLVIAYVRYTHGGAYRALREAVRQKKEIVNLYALPT